MCINEVVCTSAAVDNNKICDSGGEDGNNNEIEMRGHGGRE